MPTRFVILHHRQSDGEHWDLMIERGDVLWTWQLARNPLTPGPWPIPARRIGDHRKAYLEYEGPLTRNRGEVKRIEAGCVEITETDAGGIHIDFTAGSIRGAFALARSGPDSWVLTVAAHSRGGSADPPYGDSP